MIKNENSNEIYLNELYILKLTRFNKPKFLSQFPHKTFFKNVMKKKQSNGEMFETILVRG